MTKPAYTNKGLAALLCLFALTLTLPAEAKGNTGKQSFDHAIPMAALKGQTTWQEALPAKQDAEIELSESFPDFEWWKVYQDEKLNGYIRQALDQNPGLAAAQARIKAARAASKETLSSLFPSVKFSPGFNRIDLPDQVTKSLPVENPIHLYQMPLQASYELDLFGKNIDRIKASRREREAVVMQGRTVEITLASEVAATYFHLLGSDAQLEAVNQNIILLAHILTLKRNQYENGLVALDEVNQAERNLIDAQTRQLQYRKEQGLFAHQLSILTGTAPTTAMQIERNNLTTVILPQSFQAGNPSDMLSRRPDILQQELMMQKAGLDVRVARKAFLPTINLSSTFSLISLKFGNLFDWDNFMSQQSASLVQSLFEGGKKIAQLKAQKAHYQESVENYRQATLNALKDVEDSLSMIHSDYRNHQQQNQRASLFEKDVTLKNSLYQEGLISKLELMEIQSALLEANEMQDNSKTDALIASISLYKALGGGY